MPVMLIRLNKIPQVVVMAVFVTSLLSILDANNMSDPSLGFGLGLALGLALGLGSPSWWNQSWFTPFSPPLVSRVDPLGLASKQQAASSKQAASTREMGKNYHK